MAIPTQNLTTVEIDNLPGEEVDATIGDHYWVMQILSDVYSDAITAFIREYSTNGYDAVLDHVAETGEDPKPIEVTLPTFLNPFFVIRDHGTGMSTEVLKKRYLAYGVSDKRVKKDSNGVLGIGCKSGVAYATSFIVSSIRNGIKTEAVIRRKPDWTVGMKIVTIAKTDEANGTTITIPVEDTDFSKVAYKAKEFFKFWLPGRVLVDGVEPDHYVGEKITENMYLSKQWNASYVVMNNVPYPIPNPSALFSGTGMNPVNFVAYVGPSDVDFSKSREQLADTDLTRMTLKKIITDFTEKILAQAQAEIDNSADHAEAYSNWVKWCDLLGESLFSKLQFNGDEFVNKFFISAKRWDSHRSHRGNTYRVSDWQVRNSENVLFVTDFNPELTSSHKTKIKAWAAHTNRTLPRYVLFTPQATIDNIWLNPDNIVSWATVRAEAPKAAKGGNPGGRLTGSWDYWTATEWKTQQTIPEKGDVFYVTYHDRNYYDIYGILREFAPNAVTILVPGNRMRKLNREHPEIRSLITHARTIAKAEAKSVLDDEAKELLSYDSDVINWVRKVDVSKIDDPRWARAKDLESRRDSLLKAHNAKAKRLRLVGEYARVEGGSVDFIKEYTLLTHIYMYHYRADEDFYIYVNAVYAARKENR